MAPEAQQGGNSSFHLGRQLNPNTIISDPRKLSRFRRQFTEFALDPQGENQQSESIGGSIFGRKSQSGRLGGTGRIGTEVFTSGMLDYVHRRSSTAILKPKARMSQTQPSMTGNSHQRVRLLV